MTRNQAISLGIAAVLVALAAGWMIGRSGRVDVPAEGTADAPVGERKVLYYRNPMGLADTSPVPKKDAMGMDYVPVYAGEETAAAPGTVALSPEKIQTLGVRTEAVQRTTLASQVRASGTVEIDETREYAIAPRFEGWVAKLYANQTGMHVRAGQPLLSVYSPQLAAAQQEYRLANSAARELAKTDPASAASMARLRDAARARLRNWQVSGAQLRVGKADGNDNLVLTSPANAVVIEKPVVQGARFEAGETILRLADLSTVWVMAKVPAAQATAIAVGQPVRFTSETLPGRSFSGEVAFVQPVIDAATRTVDVRVAFPNPDGELRPGLFGTVLLEQPVEAPVLSVSRSAVLDSGTRQLVLVQTVPGRFAPREVTIGRRAGDRIEILAGVEEGEDVVVSANFLIDAESNLKSALEGLGAHAGHGASGPADEPEEPGSSHGGPSGRTEDPHAGHPASAAPAIAPRQQPDQPSAADPHAGHGAASEAPDAPPAASVPSVAPAPLPGDPHAAHGAGTGVTDEHAAHEGH
jgi:Cu(I)/Ag(I) efflux system membrane fusion protein